MNTTDITNKKHKILPAFYIESRFLFVFLLLKSKNPLKINFKGLLLFKGNLLCFVSNAFALNKHYCGTSSPSTSETSTYSPLLYNFNFKTSFGLNLFLISLSSSTVVTFVPLHSTITSPTLIPAR